MRCRRCLRRSGRPGSGRWAPVGSSAPVRADRWCAGARSARARPLWCRRTSAGSCPGLPGKSGVVLRALRRPSADARRWPERCPPVPCGGAGIHSAKGLRPTGDRGRLSRGATYPLSPQPALPLLSRLSDETPPTPRGVDGYDCVFVGTRAGWTRRTSARFSPMSRSLGCGLGNSLALQPELLRLGGWTIRELRL